MSLKKLDETDAIDGPGGNKAILTRLDDVDAEERPAVMVGIDPLHFVGHAGLVERGTDPRLRVDRLDLSDGIVGRREDEKPGFIKENDQHLAV